MQLSNAPSKIKLPFANSGTKNTVPVASQIGITAGAASYTDGFPPLTFTPVASGGVPPFGADFNGILNAATAIDRWYAAGAGFVYDSAFATDSNVGGYPKGARVLRSDGLGYWLNIADNNTTNPESGGSNWVPDYTYGVAATTMTGSNVTLAALQYGQPIINITGTLTANVQLLFPDGIAGRWAILNNTSGAFTITAKTVSGTGFSISNGVNSVIGDGTNIYSTQVSQTQQGSVAGAFSNLQSSASGTSANVSVSCNEIVLKDTTVNYKTVSSVSLTINTAASGLNGLDTGTIAASTWYSMWIISNGTNTAGLISLSSTAPTMPGGYTYKARIGWIRTDSTVNKYPLSYVQFGDAFSYVIGAGKNLTGLPVMASGTTSQVAVSVSNFAPSTAGQIDVILSGLYANNGAAVGPNATYTPSAGNTAYPITLSAQTTSTTLAAKCRMALESSNIYWYATGGSNLSCSGWVDNF